jgi:hypothetical protein
MHLIIVASIAGVLGAPSAIQIAPPSPPGTIGGLTKVNAASRGAACLDGSAPGYWMRASTSKSDRHRWIVHAEGGGWCFNEAACASRSKTDLGSSNGWGPSTKCYGKCDGILSSNETINPDFHGWNTIWIGYCDGTSMTGARNGTHHSLYYRGRANLDAVLDSLFERGMSNATDIVFTGGSAGGLAVYLNLDHFSQRVAAVSPATKVVGLADAGFFLDHPTYGTQNHAYANAIQYLFNMSTPETDETCMASLSESDAWQCMFAQYTVPFVTTPVFMAEAMYDSWQLPAILWLGCGNPTPEETCDAEQYRAFLEYGQSMNSTLVPLAGKSDRGCFLDACIVHCQSVFNDGDARWCTWTIGGTTLREAFGNFYFKRPGPTRVIDASPWPSNPSCPVFTSGGGTTVL